MILQGKKILLAVGGSISAYKIPELIRLFQKEGATVQVMMTASAQKFVAPLTLETLSGEKVLENMFEQGSEMQHIHASRTADLMVIAPATANMLAKFSYGMADDLISATLLAATCPVLIAPAMNVKMWQNFLVQDNCARLQKARYHFVGPGKGDLACGDVGEGRLVELPFILEETKKLLSVHDLDGKKVLITAGPTREFIDPVRFISNASSGKMATALIKEAYYRGADVTVITGVGLGLLPEKIKVVQVVSASAMQQAVDNYIDGVDVFISVAAVADYRPKKLLQQKLPSKNKALKLEFVPNPDILKGVTSKLGKKPFTVGFALESKDHLARAKVKFKEKKADMLIVNDVGALDAEESQVWLIQKDKTLKLVKSSKVSNAIRIFDNIVKSL